MYTIYSLTAEVFRDSDNKLIAPCASVDDPDYIDYINWIEAGNQPVIGSVSPSSLLGNQSDMWILIQNERDRRKLSGGYKVGTNWYHSDTTSRIQQLGLLMMGAGMPGGIMWKTMSGSFVLMTPTLAGQIFQSAAASDMTLFSIAESKKTAMMALADPLSYDPLSGWPKSFGE